ncbi:hypothetical protein OSB04_013642 [Centaurea solstitialis]|uniref:Importin subunit alpha n=1 Tax=Centaurea solstitialis TaxID=347529 RepID=A0AA38TYE4_9ASTR|nr:hypothetical protein OSB04_013642 [Centaurea solstitialis]
MEPEPEPAVPIMKEPEPEPVAPVLHIWEPVPELPVPVPKPGYHLDFIVVVEYCYFGNVVGNAAGQRKRQPAISVRKEIRDALFQTKRLCRVGVSIDDMDVPVDSHMIIDDEQSVLEAQTSAAVEELKQAVAFQGEGAVQRKVNALTELRHLLSRSKFSPVEVALRSGAIPLVAHCLSKGSQDDELHEAGLCLKSIAVGKPEETRAFFPALPLLIAYIGEYSTLRVPEQVACAWVLGKVAEEQEELKDILISQGVLFPLAKMMLPNKGLIARTAAWSLSRLIKGPDPKAATKLIQIDGVVDAILIHMRESGDIIATEIARVVAYLSALSTIATGVLMKTDLLQLLVKRLASSNSPHLLFPKQLLLATPQDPALEWDMLGDYSIIRELSRCLKGEYRVLVKFVLKFSFVQEAAMVLSNIAVGSVAHKELIYESASLPILSQLLSTAPFDVKKEVAYVVRNLCDAPAEGSGSSSLISAHLVSFARSGCLHGFIDLLRSADIEAARLGLQFMELVTSNISFTRSVFILGKGSQWAVQVHTGHCDRHFQVIVVPTRVGTTVPVLRGMPNGEGQQLVEKEDGIDAMERLQFHENDDLRNMANHLVDMYFREDHGLDH